MKTKFQQKWEEVSARQKSLIIAGCDPKVGTPNIIDWCKEYINAVAPYVAGIKPNPAYFQSVEGLQALKIIADFCKEKNLVSIIDYKISDIGSTNEAWIKHCALLGFDAITIAPYAGNIKETINFCKQNNCAPIMMGLMSNPEFVRETNFEMNGEKLWKYRVEDALLQEFAGLVKGKEVTFLVPGIGAQGGEVDTFLSDLQSLRIDPKKCMINVGRALMYPETSWEEEVQKYKKLTEKFF